MENLLKRPAIACAIILIAVSVSSALTVDLRSNSIIGEYLVNENGMTLYYFANDQSKVSTCFESCSATWPPFHAEWIDIPSQMKYEDFDEIGRVDGEYQTTYKNRPLYLYSGDHKAGEINGEGMNKLWFAMRP